MIETKRKRTWRITKRVFNIITDVFLYPIIVISMIIGFNSMTSKQQYEVKTYFGYSVVTVLSGSMIAGGFNIGDVVFLSPSSADNLRPGDIIAFYNYRDISDPANGQLTLITDFDEVPEPSSETRVVGNKTKQDAVNAKKMVLFHRIINVYVAEDGTRFFETKGDSNASADFNYIREEFVVGKYLNAPKFIERAVTFMSSVKGIIYIVIIPLSILIFFQIIEVVTMVFAIITERKVLAGEIPFDCEESIKANVGREMRDFDKIYFYDITPAKDKKRVQHFLWGYLDEPKSSDKDKLYYKVIDNSLGMYEKSRNEYWRFWISREKSSRKITKLVNLQKVANILNKTIGENKESVQKVFAGRALPKRPAKIIEGPAMKEMKEQAKEQMKDLPFLPKKEKDSGDKK